MAVASGGAKAASFGETTQGERIPESETPLPQVLGQTLQEAHSLHGVSVEILDPHLFVSGASSGSARTRGCLYSALGGMKPFLIEDRGRPLVFHNNFTPDKLSKVQSLERLGLWTVDARCLNSTKACCPR
jgi:hypothetical protein